MVLIEDMGGEMLLKSDVGKGAVFSVKLPLMR
jgi:signal transduction histidine kinase